MKFYFTFCFSVAIIAIVMAILLTPYRQDLRSDLDAISHELADIKQDMTQTRIRMESLTIQTKINETRVRENIRKTDELIEIIRKYGNGDSGYP